MVEATKVPTSLTKHGVRQICESDNIAQEFKDRQLILQVQDCTIFDAENTKKNIRARAQISDGVSRMICLITTKVFDQITSNGQELKKYSIWSLNVSKQTFQRVQDKPVLVLKSAPQVFGEHVDSVIGSPKDYNSNKESGQFAEHYDLRIPPNMDAKDSLSKEDLAGALESVQIKSAERPSGKLEYEYEKEDNLVSVHRSPAVDEFMPIKALNQFSSDWCIKARITRKNDLRSWKNARGEGTLLGIDLIDREGTRIQATAFNDQAHKYDKELEENCVYTFENGQVKLANKRYTSIKNDYCLTFDQNTVIRKCDEDQAIVGTGFSFTGLDKIEAMVQSNTVDVIGIALDVQQISQITLKDGQQKDKRTVTVGDENNIMIGVTIWGQNCERFDFRVGQIIAFRECRISEYRGKSLNASSGPNDIVISPQHPRAAQLQKWFGNQGSVTDMKDNMKSLGGDLEGGERQKDACVSIKEMAELAESSPEIMSEGKAKYYNVNCYLNWVFFDETLQRQMFYMACPKTKKKVMQDGGSFYCEACQVNYENESVVPTYNFSAKISDVSGALQVSVLGEVGEAIMGMSCRDFFEIGGDVEAIKDLRQSRLFLPFNVTLRAKFDYGRGGASQEDGSSIRYTLIRVTPHSFQKENNELLKMLSAYQNVQDITV